MAFNESEWDAGGVRIHFAEGPAGGRAIILLHGLAGDWQGYRQLMRRLSAGWHAYAPDLRGHGRTGRGGSYQVPDYAGDIAAFLRGVSGPAVLLGHSLGALTAIAAGAGNPELVRGLVLVDPPLFLRDPMMDPDHSLEWFRWVMEVIHTKPDFNQVLAECRKRNPDAGDAEVSALAGQLFHLAPEAVAAALDHTLVTPAELANWAGRLPMPTLLLRGDWEAGSLVRESDAEWFRRAVPQAQEFLFPGGNHLFLYEHEAETAEPILRFLQSLTPAKTDSPAAD